ncbi:MAG: Rhs element Vgr protein, partial [Pseudomonadota bacterium]
MSSMIDMIRAIVQQEMGSQRAAEMGLVLEVFPGDGGDGNHQADVRLRASGLTLRRVPVSVPRPGISLLPRVGD